MKSFSILNIGVWYIMKINKTLLIFSVVLISLFAVSAASAADANVTDIDQTADIEEIQTIEQANQQTEILEDENEDVLEKTATEEYPLSNVSATKDLNIGRNITVKVDGVNFTRFDYNYANGTFDFKDFLQKADMIGDVDFNMSKFGNFTDMFSIFKDINFSDLNKTFDFKITGALADLNYNLTTLLDDTNFRFDYNILSPLEKIVPPVSAAKVIEIFEGDKLLSNITLINGNTKFDFSELMKMIDLSKLDMSGLGNFKDLFETFKDMVLKQKSEDIFLNKTFDFKISGLLGAVEYKLILYSNETSFIFDYDISRPVADSILTPEALTTTTVNTALDGKSGGYLTMKLVDSTGAPLENKTLQLVINGVTTNVTTGPDGIAKHQINFAKAGTYYATVCFLGDETAKSSMGTAKITVNKQKTSIKASKSTYTFKSKAKTKSVKVTLKNAKGKAIKSKVITLKIKNKTFKAKTNKNGVATIKVSFTKKGKYTVKVGFAGDSTYKAISKNVKVVLK